MNWYRGPKGDQRLWFEPSEIETTAEVELANAGLVPSIAHPVVDLERFLEQHLQVELDQYAALNADVLGLTEFASGRAPRVSINADLAGAALDYKDGTPGLIGRWRATLAHEGGHVLLHRVLFERDAGHVSLFGQDVDKKTASRGLMRCLKRDVGYVGRVFDWREVQANRCMAALLMPRGLFVEVARRAMSDLGIPTPAEGSPDASVLAEELADRFAVSHQAATIRLTTLGVVRQAARPSLPMM